jgi:hypothetical protein
MSHIDLSKFCPKEEKGKIIAGAVDGSLGAA